MNQVPCGGAYFIHLVYDFRFILFDQLSISICRLSYQRELIYGSPVCYSRHITVKLAYCVVVRTLSDCRTNCICIRDLWIGLRDFHP